MIFMLNISIKILKTIVNAYYIFELSYQKNMMNIGFDEYKNGQIKDSAVCEI